MKEKITLKFRLILFSFFAVAFASAQTTVDLTTLMSINMPVDPNVSLTWHNNAAADGTDLVTDPTMAVAGNDYYASFFHSLDMCYSPGVKVPTLLNTCPSTTVDLTGLTPTSIPGGTVLEFHSIPNPIDNTTLVADATMVGAGTYYAVFYLSLIHI